MPQEKSLADGLNDFYAAQVATPTKGKAGSSFVTFRPLDSDAMAVHPSQIAEFSEDARKRGFNIDFRPDGRPRFTSSRQFREYAKAYKFRHKGYA